ncbi:unnamed protein product [Trichogramma brassicae]|uniref:Uncharacterized protein n=1 Tax=Trichogramma brassicae TaxID=86971 RepID=A0A6H5I585_9HYME|nr:unnamed protein product [Trichogramma brassicae]
MKCNVFKNQVSKYVCVRARVPPYYNSPPERVWIVLLYICRRRRVLYTRERQREKRKIVSSPMSFIIHIYIGVVIRAAGMRVARSVHPIHTHTHTHIYIYFSLCVPSTGAKRDRCKIYIAPGIRATIYTRTTKRIDERGRRRREREKRGGGRVIYVYYAAYTHWCASTGRRCCRAISCCCRAKQSDASESAYTECARPREK